MKLTEMPQQQELMMLRRSFEDIMKQREALQNERDANDAMILEKTDIIAALEHTVAELRKPDGEREGLIRSGAEYELVKVAMLSQDKHADEGSGDHQDPKESEASKQNFELTCRMASEMSRAPHRPIPAPPAIEDFEKIFAVVGDGPVEEFLRKLSIEQRLFWELQNLIDHSANLDRQLHHDLRKAGRDADVDLLVKTSGQPSQKEMQYRPLLWLRMHPHLDASYAEPAFDNSSLLTMACANELTEVAAELLERSADVAHVSKAGTSALSAACSCGSLDLTRLLLESRANANDSVGGRTPLSIVGGLKDKDVKSKQANADRIVELLLEFGALPDAATRDGNTPLLLFAKGNNLSCCQRLLKARADPSIKNASEECAMQILVRGGHCKLLEAHIASEA